MRLFNLDIHVKYKLVNMERIIYIYIRIYIFFLSYLKSVVTPT